MAALLFWHLSDNFSYHFRCMLKTSHHAGVEGYIIKNIKNQIDFALNVWRSWFCAFFQIYMASKCKWFDIFWLKLQKSELYLYQWCCITYVNVHISPRQLDNGNEWFMGAHLFPLLRQVLCLPQGPETDLLQNLDRSVHCIPTTSSWLMQCFPPTIQAIFTTIIDRLKQVLPTEQ